MTKTLHGSKMLLAKKQTQRKLSNNPKTKEKLRKEILALENYINKLKLTL